MCAVIAATLGVVLAACASFQPNPALKASFIQRAQTQTQGAVTVTVAVPSAEESAAVFGVPLAKRAIQPVWVRIENRDDVNYLFLAAHMDPNYFSPQEVAWMHRSGYSSQAKREIQVHFHDQRMHLLIPQGGTVEGFVHTHQDYGVKYVSAVLYHPGRTKEFEFIVEVPGIKADYQQTDFDRVVPPDSVREVDLEGLRRALEAYPCCVLGPDGKTPGDPLNIVVVGPAEQIFHPFIRRGWDLTETITGQTTWRTIWSSVVGAQYRTSPVSALYVDGRQQDIALQKARGSVNERNHLRMWLTPLKYDAMEVWIGQISRDIGVRLSLKTITTHKIDPQVDETRDYLVQDLLLSNSLAKLGYVGGVGTATPEKPRYNYTLDPYFTDGLRVVLVIGRTYVAADELAFLEWEWPVNTPHAPPP
jgi:hypothetical protein